jgi:hypothetical protein
MYPNADGPNYVKGFAGTCGVLGICILAYLTLPLWLLREARQRKLKTGHAMPLQAMEDAENSQVSEAAHARLHAITEAEENAAMKRDEMKLDVQHVELPEK